MRTQTIETNQFQRNVLLLPEAFDLFLGGGRGGGKSYALALLALRHIEQYKDKARVLYIRRTYKGLADWEQIGRELFGTVYGKAVSYNQAEHVFKFPQGYLELGQLETFADYQKYQGRSFTLLLIDEAGQFPTLELLDLLRSNLRGPRDMPIRMVIAANPGGVGHAEIAKRFVFKAAKPYTPFFEEKSKRKWVYAPSTYVGNDFIDTEEYKSQLEAACGTDPELLKAWLLGEWQIARGAYFSSVLSETRNAVDPWTELPKYHGWPWETYMAHDWGASAPSVTYVVAQSPGAIGPDGQFYPRDSLILVDELATNARDQLNKGLGWTIPILAEEIVAMSKRWGMPRAEGVADDACFAKSGHQAGSIADEFARQNVYWRAARKADRLSGWAIMRRLLQDAGKPDVPGLYISRACEYWWATVPYLGRDMKRVEDVDSQGPDHGADATRYACLRLRNQMVPIKIVGI